MDWANIGKKASYFFAKYKYAILILLIGVAFMLIPGGISHGQQPQEETQKEQESKQDIMQEISAILSQIEGVGKVKVLLTVSAGESIVFQQDEEITTGEKDSTIHRETVIITDSNRGQSALVQQINPPKYQGAIIVCEGADKSAVRLHIIEAVSNITGLGTDRISVLKMK